MSTARTVVSALIEADQARHLIRAALPVGKIVQAIKAALEHAGTVKITSVNWHEDPDRIRRFDVAIRHTDAYIQKVKSNAWREGRDLSLGLYREVEYNLRNAVEKLNEKFPGTPIGVSSAQFFSAEKVTTMLVTVTIP